MRARAIQKHVHSREYGEFKTEVVLVGFSGIAFLMAAGALLLIFKG